MAVAALVIGGVVVGAGALAFLALSPQPIEPDEGRPAEPQTQEVKPAEEGDTAVVPLGARSSDVAAAPQDGAPWLEFPGYEEALQAIHWDQVGVAYSELLPLLEARFRAISRQKPLSAADNARIDDLWSTLDVLATPMRERTSYVYGNGVFTHPAYVANSVPATLHALGRGLTSDQLAELRAEIADALDSEDHIEKLEHEPMFVGTLRAMAEAEARRGLSDAVNGVLTERQNGALHPGELLGRVGLDPFHAVEMFRGKMIVVQCEDVESGARQVADLVAVQVGTDEVRIEQAAAFAQGMVASAIEETFPEGVRRIDVAGHIDIERALIVARKSGEFMTDLVLLLSGGEMPVIPPEVLDRPIILIGATND